MRASKRRCIALAAVLTIPTAAHNAMAQSAQNAATAEALFDQAKELMREKKYAEACPKFAESNRLDAGIGTMLWLADCYEKNGQYASAWGEFEGAADAAAQQHDDREKVAREHAVALEPSLSKLTIRVPPANEVPGLDVTHDGIAVGKALWGTQLPVDPGTHMFVASAPGKKPWRTTLEVAALSRTGVVTVPLLEDEAVAVSPSPGDSIGSDQASPSATPALPDDAAPLQPTNSKRTALRIAGIAVGGVGIVGVGIGSIFGLQAKSHLDESNAGGHCQPDNHCDAIGTQARNQAIGAATVSTIGFVAGGVCIAGGVVLFLVAPRSSAPASAQGRRGPLLSTLEVHPMLGAYERGVSLHGSF